MTIKHGGPAFPVTLFDGQTLGDGTANGMTLRDYFAAKAMQALIHVQVKTGQAVTADTAYQWADAMLEAREQV